MMWTLDGVPEVVAQLFLSRANIWFHEFQSLTDGELAVENELTETEFWRPKQSVKRESIPGAPVPAATASKRLIQMNQVARRFAASVKFKQSPRKRDLTRYELRRLPRPIYRYQSDSRNIVDGTLYAFVQGTNPEVFLLIEAHQQPTGMEYRYGLSPMTGYEVSAKIDANEVWREGPQKRPFPPDGRFFFVHHQPVVKK